MDEQPHKRRVRYKGTHPRNFKEKYKELNPEKYAETVEKVISGGGTPAGMHISICVKEILEFLDIKPSEVGLDATLGYGGHSEKMLQKLEPLQQGHLYAIDVDPLEMAKTKARLQALGYNDDILTIKQLNFANIDQFLPQKFDFVLADLGVSSMQIDNPDRGFSYKNEGPLDLRLNPLNGITAAERLKHITQPELQGMLLENADEPYAEQISSAIIRKIRRNVPIETTTALAETIEQALQFIPAAERKEAIKKSCQRTFQALRIDVNEEFEVLYEFLEKLPTVLKSGGRVAILSFHSGEDRLVKKSFKRFHSEGIYVEIAAEVTRPSKEECYMNGRAKSAKMRWAIRK